MNTITFDKDRYHQHVEMEQWCRYNIGKGVWCYGHSDEWRGTDADWRISSMFGQITFSFRKSTALTWFSLNWS